ncbi:hypothetical protein CPB84DRAFT_971034 [Gymnopilus junonius]|uniref:Uncharacterized protein n=1 Tax=Gymnopilus junonius TaxID=109634 RepID=A0A9P5NLK9_GYMJU|nr:hypothetical protein CPB84DRAFT_971034 [Gymnopilus junonius]
MSASRANQMHLLHPFDTLNPMSCESRENQHSITFPLSTDILRTHLSGNPPGNCVSEISSFTFLPQAVDNLDEQASVLRSLLQRSSCIQLSFRFVFNVDQSLGNITNFRVEDLTYGGGMIDIVNEIILPNIDRLHYLDCLLSPTVYSQLLECLPDSSLLALADVNITFVHLNGQPSSTFGVHSRFTFTRGRSGSNVMNPFPPLTTVLPLQPMTNIELGA